MIGACMKKFLAVMGSVLMVLCLMQLGSAFAAGEPSFSTCADEKLITRFIILTDLNKRKCVCDVVEQCSKALLAALKLEGTSEIDLINKSCQISEILGQHIQTVIIASGAYVPDLFEAINTGQCEGKIYAVILIDPVVAVKGVLHPLGDPIAIDYSKISNRVYNFYSEAGVGFTRKIRSWLNGTDKEHIFLKGVNVKSQYVSRSGATFSVDFDDPELLRAFLQNLPAVITEIDRHYQIENDLSGTLFSFNEAMQKSADCPVVTVNERTIFEKDVLKSHLYSNLFWDSYENCSKHLTPSLINFLEQKKTQEYMYSIAVDPFKKKVKSLSFIARRIMPMIIITWGATGQAFGKEVEKNCPREVVAQVRTGPNQGPDELVYMAKRLPKVAARLGIDPDGGVPRIALVASGGGVRAMLSTLGVLQGLEETGLMDTITYACGLSGSTWAIGPWISSGLPLNDFSRLMVNQLNPSKMVSPDSVAKLSWNKLLEMTGAYYYKKENLLPYSIVDIYGKYLIDYLLPDVCKHSYLSQQADLINDGSKPLPIYTAIRADGKTMDQVAKDNKWYEFTPYEIGAQWLGSSGMYIPSWAIGRSFKNGTSTNFVCEQPLGLHLGIFGSAFALNVGMAYQVVGQSVSWFARAVRIPLGAIDPDRQIAAGGFKNFTYNMRQSALKNQKILQMVDAGIAINLPYPPVSGHLGGRKADVLIFVDATDDAQEPASEIRKVAQFAKNKRLPFPDLDEHEIDIKTLEPLGSGKFEKRLNVSVRMFMSPVDGNAPLVIYVRFERDAQDTSVAPNFAKASMLSSCATLNFAYPVATANKVIDMMKKNITLNGEYIEKAILRYQKRMEGNCA